MFLRRLDVWNLIPGEGSAEVVKAMVKEKIQVGYMRDGTLAPVYVSKVGCFFVVLAAFRLLLTVMGGANLAAGLTASRGRRPLGLYTRRVDGVHHTG